MFFFFLGVVGGVAKPEVVARDLESTNLQQGKKKIEEKENIPADVLNPGIVGINFSVPA